MGLFKAVAKAVARAANDASSNRKQDNVKNTTYKQTGEQLRQAKKNGTYINGRALYLSNLKKNERKIEQSRKNTEKFIDSL